MGQPVIDLSNSNNWLLVWEKLTIAQRVVIDPEKQFHPIPSINMPVQLESHIFAVLIENQKARSSWRYAGRITQLIQTGIIGYGGSNDVEVAEFRKLWLNRVSLYIFPKVTNTFSLKFDVPRWFEEISITVWEYIGLKSDSTETLINSLKQDVLRLEAKVDDISSYGG
jgi:hypothetical protein